MRARFFGQYLLARGLVTAPQLLAAVEYQERSNTRVGEHAISRSLLTPFEIEQIRALQTREDLFFGEAAIKLGILTAGQVRDLLADQGEHHVMLGDALAELGYLDPVKTEKALAEFLSAEDALEPEVVTIPEDLPHRYMAFELFHIAHKLLRRAWGLDNKTDRLRVEAGPVTLSDRNACVQITGAAEMQIFVCVPFEIAQEAARELTGELDPVDADRDRIVREFANLLCANLQSILAEQGRRIHIEEAQTLNSRVSLTDDAHASIVTFLTHRGQVHIGMTH
jgi:CheY-specific phosphatase CheX